MKRTILSALTLLSAMLVSAVPLAQVGSIDYEEGSVSVSRNGKVMTAPDLGDPILAGDLIQTKTGGKLEIALDKGSGMSGTITVKQNSSLYINLDIVKGESRTDVQLLTGSLASKVSKLAGSPSVTVSTSSAVMAVRGTEFEIGVSPNADDNNDSLQPVVVVCTQSKVAVDDGSGEVEVPAGKVLEKRPGAKPHFIPVAVTDAKDFSEKWMTEEIDAFKADAPRALAAYAKRYSDLSKRFEEAYAQFRASPLPKKWADEDRSGSPINQMDPQVLKERKQMAGYLFPIRKVLVIFERVYFRIDQLSDLVRGTPAENKEIAPGVTVKSFLAQCEAQRDALAGEVARYRYIDSLFNARDFSSGDDNDDFSSNSDF